MLLAKDHSDTNVPLHMRNAASKLMKEMGYAEGYKYDHDFPNQVSPMESMPEKLKGRIVYRPGNVGFEKDLAKRMQFFDRMRKENQED